MKEMLEKAATALSEAAVHLKAMSQQMGESSSFDWNNLTAEDKHKLGELFNVWLSMESDKRFDEVNKKISELAETVTGIDAELTNTKSELEGIETDEIEYFNKIVRNSDIDFERLAQLNIDDINSVMEKLTELDVDEVKSAIDELRSVDFDDFYEKGDLPDFENDYDIDDMAGAVVDSKSALEKVENLEGRVDDLEPVSTILDLFQALGIDPRELTRVIRAGKKPVLESVSG